MKRFDNLQMPKFMVRRNLHIVVLSDVHLGAYACHAKELLKYLQGIAPEVLILNGDFIDSLKQEAVKLPKSHKKVISAIIDLAQSGTKVYYISCDKESVLRSIPKFTPFSSNIRSELVLLLKGRKHWIFHGGQKSRASGLSLFNWINRYSYRFLVNSNKMINRWRISTGKSRMSHVGGLKDKAKHAINLVEEFEDTAVHLALQQGYDAVICGHIHEPGIKDVNQEGKSVRYMNAGDWVENLTALEYRFGKWSIYEYNELDYTLVNPKLQVRSKNAKRAKSDLSVQAGNVIQKTSKPPVSKVLKQKLKTN